MDITELLDKVKTYLTEENSLLIEKAFKFAQSVHQRQKRVSGEPFIEHPLETATILAELKMDANTIAAAILHDTVEDTSITLDDIKREFGEEIAQLVDGVTKLSAISLSKEQGEETTGRLSKKEDQAANLRKIFLAMAKNINVILIKLADRLHNLRTLSSLHPPKRKYVAKETLDIFAPLASRLGLWNIKWELEDLAFSYLEPSKYKELSNRISQKRTEREKVIKHAMGIIKNELAKHNINAHLEGRPKHLYSVYQKMKRKDIEFSEVYDLFAVRIIVNTVEECYAVLGIIHSLWMPIKDRLRDFIAMPKPNNYRSLHTTIYGPGNRPLEVQIRTKEMHAVNDFGIAAHWAYKEDAKSANHQKEILPWINRILDWQAESVSDSDYIKNLKGDILRDQVFVFTPKTDVLELPNGSTPLDFAYRIHTDIGHRCIGAKVNAKIIPLDYHLQTGDIVEIITSKNLNPSKDWLKICRTSHAKNKIRQWFKKEKRDENINIGKTILERELKRQHLGEISAKKELLEKTAEKLNFKNLDDLLASLGYGETTLTNILAKLKDELPKEEYEKIIISPKRKRPRKLKQPIRVKGVDNLLIRLAKCCLPVYGDEIIGFVTLGKGVSIHRKDCPNLLKLIDKKEKILEVEWEPDFQGTFSGIDVEVEALDRSGLLSDIMGVLSEQKISATSCKAWAKGQRAIVKIGLEVTGRAQLDDIMQRIGKLRDVISVSRGRTM